MNNSITILIDSVFAECISENKTEVSSTPFIDKLAKKSLVAKSIYSYGPYTDAATIGLYNGIPTLSNFGYYYGVNSSDYNHFRVFHEAGYETFGIFYPYYLLSSKVRKYIDNPIYTGGFKYRSVWEGKFEYFAKIRETRKLTEFEYDMMFKCLDMVFDCWYGFYHDLEENHDSAVIVNTLYDQSIGGTGKKQLLYEIDKYKNDRKAYIDELLSMGMSHPLASINEFDYGKTCDKNFLETIYKRHKKFISKLECKNIICNLRNNRFSFSKACRGIAKYLKTRNKAELRYIGNYGMMLLSPQMMKKRSLEKRDWQEMASLDKQINVLLEALDRRENHETPFYASLHVLEPHHNISFFSFDCFNMDQIDKEIDYVYPVVEECGGKFSGNLIYQLSLRYVDMCVMRLYEELEKRGLIENTTITLVADHGTSYFFNPVRTHVVNTFHKENYNIPLLIFNKHMPETICKRFDGMYSSEDILPTLFSINGVKCPSQMKGRVIFSNNSDRDFVITEYMGPGVPDMINRDVWMSARSNKYVVAYINSLNQHLDVKKPAVLYDLQDDPNELYNIASKNIESYFENEEFVAMTKALEYRFEEIKRERDYIVDNFKNFTVC